MYSGTRGCGHGESPPASTRVTAFALPSIKGHHLGVMAQRGHLLPGSSDVGVIFHFAESAEVRYLSHPPAPGTRVRDSNGHLWIVRSVVRTGEMTFSANCVTRRVLSAPARAPRPQPVRSDPHTRRGALAAPARGTKEPDALLEDRSPGLLTLARRLIGTPKRLRRRYGMRHHLP
jgi:hypothetical protein